MRTTMLLFCVAAALVPLSDASSPRMLPALQIGLALGSSFLRRLAEMKDKIRQDLDRQAPVWAHLLQQQHTFAQMPWPVVRLQGSFHGGQTQAFPGNQAPPVLPFTVIRPCRPNGPVPCLSTLASGDIFPQGVRLQAGRPSGLPTGGPSRPSQPSFDIPQPTALAAVALVGDLEDKTDSTAVGTEGTVATTAETTGETAAVAEAASTAMATAPTTTAAVTDIGTRAAFDGTDEGTVATTAETTGETAAVAEAASTATATVPTTTACSTDTGTCAAFDGTDEGTVATAGKTTGAIVTFQDTAGTAMATAPATNVGNLAHNGMSAALTTRSPSATEHETTQHNSQVTPATTELTSRFPTTVSTGAMHSSTAETTKRGTVPTYFIGENNIPSEKYPTPVFAKLLENDLGHSFGPHN